MHPSTLRIIGGKFKRRRISFNTMNNLTLRPTLDRMRETIFNWLTPYLLAANCLDLFAGTGIFSFEALSRGANCAVAIELNLATFHEIIANQHQLKIPTAQLAVLNQDVNQILTLPHQLLKITNNQLFNLVFLDPPYTDPNILLITLNNLIIHNNILANHAKIYFECSKDNDIVIDVNFPQQLQLLKFSHTNKINFYLFDYYKY